MPCLFTRRERATENIPARILRKIVKKMNQQVHWVTVTEAAETRSKTGLSQPRFAELLGVSVRTLQEWEQGRRSPSGAARSLLHIASLRPDVFRYVP
ncbi:helix-turn-helix domain-containing protein [Pseudomonas sp. 10B1]|nr:helix-turn-helix domain-containing protein [Pseudomonas sp. AB6]MEA9993865.1 helix-turn-helix domain-containing protein [Pseudomonas sp. AA4]MEB0085455.1 helix-turn-helix domain-containing protein [Pseudomonas sp. RTI1]MEB0124517.1 helix-turn-helix domain-containing protein [Pseudomonas sp. CCC1.2]MEB0152336.1 helix-turn-helix domain-containing protein [Pseudomonas sp. CCC4.3]MEB0178784.1 helix-turn-helix domain-containing protein [Pseudomonas sp. CCC3.2]MEB0219325.1 helix-turn-helix domai